MAELMVTLDPLTTGFAQDLQLIIQMAIDKFGYKVRIGLHNFADFATVTLTSLSNSDINSPLKVLKFAKDVTFRITELI